MTIPVRRGGRAGVRACGLRASLDRAARCAGQPDPWPAPSGRPIERPPVKASASISTRTGRADTGVRLARAVVLDEVHKSESKVVASPRVIGLERLDPSDGPMIFAANHASHLDTRLLLTSCRPGSATARSWPARPTTSSTAAARPSSAPSPRGAVPMDRIAVSIAVPPDLADLLIAEGWSLIIFPEGGRTPDGWAQEFKGGAAYLATRGDVPVVPIHLEGSRRAWRKGGGLRPHDDPCHVRQAAPSRTDAEEARALAAELEQAVAVLADEQATDWWSARQRAAAGHDAVAVADPTPGRGGGRGPSARAGGGSQAPLAGLTGDPAGPRWRRCPACAPGSVTVDDGPAGRRSAVLALMPRPGDLRDEPSL